MKIAIIGTGYVGLVSGACFADFGHHVTCVDKDAGKIETLERGEIPIFEPGLDKMVASNIAEGRLSFSTSLTPAVAKSDAVFIAVGTPTKRGDGLADLTYVYQAAEEIAEKIEGFTVIVNKSTVPIGTGLEVERRMLKKRPDAEFAVVSNPEFLREGVAIDDFIHPDRVVIGTDDEKARAVMSEIYQPLSADETPILFTSRETSETIKYAANAFLALKISFINELADLCEVVGGDVKDIAKGIGLDKRIGQTYLNVGPGFGGSCFPKDTIAFMRTARDAGSPMTIVETLVEVNNTRKANMAQKVIAACDGNISGKKIAVLGLTFKPDTDDMREAPSLFILPELQKAGAKITAFDPEGMEEAAKFLPGVDFASSAYDAMTDADAAVIITEWQQFRDLDLGEVKSHLKSPIIVDLRNIYDPSEMQDQGFSYTSLGRKV